VVTEADNYAIETFSLTKIFPDWWGRAKVIAVDDLNLKVKYNEIYGLLGPNGSGKTTTLKMMLNLLFPTKGRALVLGGSTSESAISSKIGYLPEESYLYKYLSAKETLDFYGRLFGLPRAVRKSRIEALLEMVGLTGMANRSVGTFSKGMARRIGLAQALINDPEILILDEPTSGMDPISTRQMKDLFARLAKRGKTILLCSHLLSDVEDVCDRIGILYGGKMQVEGDVRQLLQHKDERLIRTGNLSESAIEKIRSIAGSEDKTCEISSPMDKLEDFFIDTVAMAEQQHLPTSGAKSTTEIGGFLVEESRGENILDKLVSATVSEEVSETAGDAEVAETVSVDSGSGDADNALLDDLTKTPAVSDQTDAVHRDQPVETRIDDEQEVKHDLLEGLTGDDKKGDGLTEQTNEDSSGDIQDA